MLKVSYIVNSVFTSRTYILSVDNSSEFWLVDCGDVPPLIEKLSSMVCDLFSIKGVLLTHAHYDHIYGLPHLTELFPQIKVYTNQQGKDALANERVNMSRYHEDPIKYESKNVIVCDEGSEIPLFTGLSAKVCYTPGHNLSCLTYEVGDYIFTGDAFIPGVSVVTSLPGSDKKLAIKSLERILKMAEGKNICPGHELKND